MTWDQYRAPDGFRMFMTGDNDPFIVDASSPQFNAPQRAKDLMDRVDERAAAYRSPEIFMVFGEDFKYINAHWMFTQLDNMIEYMNEHHGDKYVFRYSTPSEYVSAVNAHDLVWPSKTDDFMPYGAGGHDYWTGYYTSRANAKAYVRRTSSAFTASSALYSLKMIEKSEEAKDLQLKIESANYAMLDAIGILQHHDAITGTAK